MFNFKNALKKYSLFVLLTSATLLIQTWLLWRGSTDLEISNFIYSISKIIEFGIIGLVALVSLKSFGGLNKLIRIEEPKTKIIPPFKINKILIFILSGIISVILIVLVLFWQISIYNSKTETKTKSDVSSKIDKKGDAEKKFNLAIDKYQESLSAFTDAEKNQTNDYDKAVSLMIESTNLLVDSYNEFSDEYKAKATAQINANKNEIELRINNELKGVELCPDKKCKDDYSSKISQLKRYESEVKSNSNVDNSENVQNGNTSFDFDYDMVYVQGGTFQMGSNDGNEDEKPVHTVGLGGFYIGKTEVTQAQWRAVMGNNPSDFKGDNLPVETVSWNMVQTFIKKLNQLTGKQYRLPTEAEWEYAARGGNKSKGTQYAGSNNIDKVAWYSDNSGSKTHVVASKQPNELGLYDMSGNVWEWCSDWYGNYFTTAQTNPKGASSGSTRVYRGGCWRHNAGSCRTAHRSYGYTPDESISFIGFRLVSPK